MKDQLKQSGVNNEHVLIFSYSRNERSVYMLPAMKFTGMATLHGWNTKNAVLGRHMRAWVCLLRLWMRTCTHHNPQDGRTKHTGPVPDCFEESDEVGIPFHAATFACLKCGVVVTLHCLRVS